MCSARPLVTIFSLYTEQKTWIRHTGGKQAIAFNTDATTGSVGRVSTRTAVYVELAHGASGTPKSGVGVGRHDVLRHIVEDTQRKMMAQTNALL